MHQPCAGPVVTFPEWVEPMTATLTYERFTGADWVFERKYDGIRALAFKQGRDVRLLSRNRLPQHNPAVHEAIAQLDVLDVILDGELTWRRDSKVSYYVFDVLWLSGRDISRETIQLMLDEGYVDAWRRLHPNDLGYTFPTWDPHVRLDYVFVSERYVDRIAVCEVVGTPPELIKDASDHAPILVEVR